MITLMAEAYYGEVRNWCMFGFSLRLSNHSFGKNYKRLTFTKP